MGHERVAVIAVGAFLIIATIAIAVMVSSQIPQRGVFFGSQPVQYVDSQHAASSSSLRADVKGSIYENGSNMTVFGACYDGDGVLLPSANASFTAWFPDGSVMLGPGAPMTSINSTGRWLIHVTMPDTVGTYLTEFRCDDDGQWATALGEWQNPEWVGKIGAIALSMGNVTSLLDGLSVSVDSFRNASASNFSALSAQIASLNVSGTNDANQSVTQYRELLRNIKDIDATFWVIDDSDPFYVPLSGTNDMFGVAVNGRGSVRIAGDGHIYALDDEVWSEENVSGLSFIGVDMLESPVVYAWYVGRNVSDDRPVIDVNGQGVLYPSLPGDASTGLSDVVIVPSLLDVSGSVILSFSNVSSGSIIEYVMADDGRIYQSSDGGVTWVYLFSSGSGHGRLGFARDSAGELLIAGQGSDISVARVNVSHFTVNGTVKDVVALSSRDALVVVDGADSSAEVYEYTGSNLSLIGKLEGFGNPVGISAAALDDITVMSSSTGVFAHYDGTAWSAETSVFSSGLSVSISFGNSSVNSSGMHAMRMVGTRVGYAVGDDGLVLVYQNHYDERLSEMETMLENLTVGFGNGTVNASVNFSEVLDALSAMNASIQSSLANVSGKIDALNASMQLSFSQVLANETYGQALVNVTIANTLSILAQLGIISGQLNQSIALENQTNLAVQTLVNETSPVHAWTTQ